MSRDYSQAEIARYVDFQRTSGHTHIMVVERGEVSLRRDGPEATLSAEAVTEMGRGAAAWAISRAARAMEADYRPHRLTMIVTVALDGEVLPEDGGAHFLSEDEDAISALREIEGDSLVAEMVVPPDETPEEERHRMADAGLDRFEDAATMWVVTRIALAWPRKGPAHKVTMAVKALIDGGLPDSADYLPGGNLRAIDGSLRFNGKG